jgi:pimeloyl-ACP methyl ester carboxylesterase
MVYLLEAFTSMLNLSWTQNPSYHTLPNNIHREFVKTPSGEVELLVSPPSLEQGLSTSSKPPVLFVHGGLGHASVWLPWMTYLRRKHYAGTTYAVSVRGHGASWAPRFWQMWALTTKDDVATDVVAAINEIEKREEGKRVVLVGHSAGGGLSQLILSNGLAKAQGLALIAAIPNFGS